MAVALEFNIISKSLIDLEIVMSNSPVNAFNVEVGSVCCIDNWIWENPQEMQSLSLVHTMLETAKIIVINLKCSILKDAGIYIEKNDEEYVYNLWINTEGYPVLDEDKISPDNEHYFQKIYRIIEELREEQGIDFRIIGIGFETCYQYERENSEVIKKSKNVIAWILSKYMNSNMELSDYRKKDEIGELIIFEKDTNKI